MVKKIKKTKLSQERIKTSPSLKASKKAIGTLVSIRLTKEEAERMLKRNREEAEFQTA